MKINDETVLFGCDPEVFAGVDGYVISPALLEKFSGLKRIGGDTKHPSYIKTSEYIWMMDGVAFEITLLNPYKTRKEMQSVVKTATNHLEEFLSQFKFEGRDLSLQITPTININPEMYKRFLDDESIFQGFIFGCDKDYDAIDPEYRCSTQDVYTYKYRHGGGHFHTSGLSMFKYFPDVAIKFYVLTVGNYCTTHSKSSPELEKLRIQTYGRPGRFRPQKYKNDIFGIEYRTPSNSWVNFSSEEMEEIEFWERKALQWFVDERMDIIEYYIKPSATSIVNFDQEKSMAILKELENIK